MFLKIKEAINMYCPPARENKLSAYFEDRFKKEPWQQ